MEPMVDVKRLEEVYGNPRSWWYDKAEKGEVPSFKVGKYRRFRLSEIETWLATKRHGSGPAR
jgi:predicted DNA-binding transcriptional regulator AlpA